MPAHPLDVPLVHLSPARLRSILPDPLASAVRDEIHRTSSTYYAEFEELYHIYNGWEQLADRYFEEYNAYKVQKRHYRAVLRSYLGDQDRELDARAFALDPQRELLEKENTRLRGLLEGPVGLCLLRRRYLAAHEYLDKGAYLTNLPSLKELEEKPLVKKVARVLSGWYHSASLYQEGPSWSDEE